MQLGSYRKLHVRRIRREPCELLDLELGFVKLAPAEEGSNSFESFIDGLLATHVQCSLYYTWKRVIRRISKAYEKRRDVKRLAFVPVSSPFTVHGSLFTDY